MADDSITVRSVLFPSLEVRQLCKDFPAAWNLEENFLDTTEERKIKVQSFAETLPTKNRFKTKILVQTQSESLGIEKKFNQF